MGRVGNNSRMDSTRVSRDLVLQNFKNMMFLIVFSLFPWGSKKNHMSLYNSYTINFVTILIRTALKSEYHWKIFRNRVQEIIKINQPNTFQNLTCEWNYGFQKPGSRLRQPPGGLYFQKWPPTQNVFLGTCKNIKNLYLLYKMASFVMLFWYCKA